jgi:UDP-GlcNAc:undecaprenyl-phosphate GlcNAc-1-phosphate transferase
MSVMAGVIAALAAGFLALLLTPHLGRLGRCIGAVDVPGLGDPDQARAVRIGGFAVHTGITVGLLVLYSFASLRSALPIPILLASSTVVFLLGVLDDTCKLRAGMKFVGQLLVGLLVALGGLHLHFFPWPVANIASTVFLIAALCNAQNLIDGMDGLSAGTACLSAAFFGVTFAGLGLWHWSLVCLLVFVTTLGFLRTNLLAPRGIYLGDCGSQLLGFWLAVFLVVGLPLCFDLMSTVYVLALVAFPALETAVTIIRRTVAGRSPFAGDRHHSYDWLLRRGLSQKRTACLFYIGVLAIGVASLSLRWLPPGVAATTVVAVLLASALVAHAILSPLPWHRPVTAGVPKK